MRPAARLLHTLKPLHHCLGFFFQDEWVVQAGNGLDFYYGMMGAQVRACMVK